MSGCLPDPDDPRDHLFSFGSLLGSTLTPAPSAEAADLWFPSWGVRNQGDTNRCVGFSIARMLRIGYVRDSGNDPGDFSANDAYFKARLEHNAEDKDQGTYIRAAFKGLQKYGCAPESVRPSTLEDVNTPTTWREQKAAHKYRGFRSYHRVDTSGDSFLSEIRTAISSGFAVVAGWGMPSSFYSYSGGVYQPKDKPRPGLGHAMAIVGYRRDGSFKLESNFGPSFGENGFVYASEDFVTSAWSAWVGDVTE